MAKSIVVENEFHYADKHGNVWLKARFTKEQANELALTLKNCTNCSNCSNCVNCINCFSCHNCNDCIDSRCLTACHHCVDTQNCKSCHHLIFCRDCLMSSYLANSENVKELAGTPEDYVETGRRLSKNLIKQIDDVSKFLKTKQLAIKYDIWDKYSDMITIVDSRYNTLVAELEELARF